MNEEQLSQLTIEEKLKVAQFLVADLAGGTLSEDPSVARHAIHNISALAMLFSNLQELTAVPAPERATVMNALHRRFRYQPPTE